MKCQACQTAHAQVYCQESQAALCKGCSYVMGDITRFRLCALCECHPAKVFCHNDNAALCESCDADIHLSNPLALRHDRVPLGPLASDLPKVSAGSSRGWTGRQTDRRGTLGESALGGLHLTVSLWGSDLRAWAQVGSF